MKRLLLFLFFFCVSNNLLQAADVNATIIQHTTAAGQGRFDDMVANMLTAQINTPEDQIAQQDLETLKTLFGRDYVAPSEGTTPTPEAIEAKIKAAKAAALAAKNGLHEELNLAIISSTAGTLEARQALQQSLKQALSAPAKPPSKIGKFMDAASPYVGLTAYHGFDRIIKLMADQAKAEALLAHSPQELTTGYSKSPMGGMATGAAAIRHGVGAAGGLIPLVSHLPLSGSDESDNDASKHSNLSKGLGIGHLATRGANILTHLATMKAHELTPQQARALAYHNRRHGALQELIDMERRVKTIERIRLALNVLGSGILPGIFANPYNADNLPDEPGTPLPYTSRGLALTNGTGIIDSALGIYSRLRNYRAMRQLQNQMPAIIQDLVNNPPTEQEMYQDQMGGMGPDPMGGMMPGMPF